MGLALDDPVSSWRVADDAGFQLVSCFDHVTAAPRDLAAWDAPSLLVAMAGRTTRARLAVDVVNTALRHPFLLARQLAVARAASGGRLEVGLGLGSWDSPATSTPGSASRSRRVSSDSSAFAAAATSPPRLWRGEDVTDAGFGIHDASLGPVGIEQPPVIVGGTSEEVIAIAAELADGWNAVASSAAEYAEAKPAGDGTLRRRRA